MKPLAPLYVSTVDSGNLAGHLLTLRAGLVALGDARIVDPRWFEGLGDTLRTLAEALGAGAPEAVDRLRRDLETAYDSRPANTDIDIWVVVPSMQIQEHHTIHQNFAPGSSHKLLVSYDQTAKKFGYEFN